MTHLNLTRQEIFSRYNSTLEQLARDLNIGEVEVEKMVLASVDAAYNKQERIHDDRMLKIFLEHQMSKRCREFLDNKNNDRR
jgi:hypothetical protein